MRKDNDKYVSDDKIINIIMSSMDLTLKLDITTNHCWHAVHAGSIIYSFGTPNSTNAELDMFVEGFWRGASRQLSEEQINATDEVIRAFMCSADAIEPKADW